jgi:hypothetical protein
VGKERVPLDIDALLFKALGVGSEMSPIKTCGTGNQSTQKLSPSQSTMTEKILN